jgi:hypothetical protein
MGDVFDLDARDTRVICHQRTVADDLTEGFGEVARSQRCGAGFDQIGARAH